MRKSSERDVHSWGLQSLGWRQTMLQCVVRWRGDQQERAVVKPHLPDLAAAPRRSVAKGELPLGTETQGRNDLRRALVAMPSDSGIAAQIPLNSMLHPGARPLVLHDFECPASTVSTPQVSWRWAL